MLFEISMPFTTKNFSDQGKLILSKDYLKCQISDAITEDILKKSYLKINVSIEQQFFLKACLSTF